MAQLVSPRRNHWIVILFGRQRYPLFEQLGPESWIRTYLDCEQRHEVESPGEQNTVVCMDLSAQALTLFHCVFNEAEYVTFYVTLTVLLLPSGVKPNGPVIV